jgi:GT2 family glycosyltransferase
MRWDFEAKQFTSDIDAIGIRLLRNRRAVEWLTRERWAKDSLSKDVCEMYDKKTIEVFGVSGAFPMYRKSALDKLLLPGGNIFDPTYHSYKEDLDLAYRLRNAGYTSYVLLDAVAYHDRTAAGPKTLGDVAAAKNKRLQSKYVRFHSYKNHLRTLYKNEYWQNFLLDSPFILWFELKKFVYYLLTSPLILFKSWWEIFIDFKYMREAKKAIHASRKMYWKGLRRWF